MSSDDRSQSVRRTLVVAVLAVTVLVGIAPAIAAGTTAADATDAGATVDVTTLAPDPGETVAYLGGNLTTVDGADGANLSVEYRHQNATEWQRSDEVQQRQSPDTFYVKVTDLEPGTTYEYRARADTWDGAATDVGDVQTVTTTDYPAVETGERVGATETSFTVRSNLTDLGGNGASTIRLEYRAVDSSSWFQVAEEQRAEQLGHYWLDADGLEADTAYEYRAVAVDADGLAGYGERQTTRTDVPAEVRTGEAYVSGANGALFGEVVSTGNASETEAHVAYRQSGAETWTRAGWTAASEPRTYSANVTGLVSGATYEYRAVLRTSDGDDDLGEIRTFEVATAPSVATAGTTDVTDASATLHGNLTDAGGADSVDVGAQYRERGSSAWTATALETRQSVGGFSTAIAGLDPGTAYEVRALAVAPDGERATGGIQTVTTDTAPVVRTAGTADLEPTSVTLSGSLDDLGGADAVDVAIEYRRQGDGSWTTADAGWLHTAGEFATTVDGLDESTAYEFRAVGVADDGIVATGDVRTVETPATTSPPAVTSVRTTEDSPPNPHAELSVDWSVADEDGDLAGVTVEVRDSRGRLLEQWGRDVAGSTASGSEYAKVKHGAGETYTVIVTATDEEGTATAEETIVLA